MKMVDGDKVYIQESDARVVMDVTPLERVPQAIVDICNSESDSSFIELIEQDGIDFINSLDYLINYSELDFLSLTDTLSMNQRILADLNRAFRLYNEAINLNDEDSIRRAKIKLDLLRYKEACMKEMIQNKRGSVTITSYSMIPKRKMRVFSFISNKGRE